MKVLVLAGGKSEERAVSLKGGDAVCRALNSLSDYHADVGEPDILDQPTALNYDVVFPVLHGADGEDGRLQRRLDLLQIPYVGSGEVASNLTFHKHRCSQFLQANQISCPKDFLLQQGEVSHDLIDELRSSSNQETRWVVKPCRQGSSVGISIVDLDSSRDTPVAEADSLLKKQTTSSGIGLQAALEKAFDFDDACVVQQYVAGEEVTIALLDGEVLPPVAIQTPGGFYDYSAKYESSETRYAIDRSPAALEAQQIAIKIADLCATSGLVRIDFRIDTMGIPQFLEVNTIPGLTDRSLVPMSAKEHGWSMAELCRRAVEGAVPVG